MAKDYILEARMQVLHFFNSFRNEGVPELELANVYVVWYNQTLHTWKAFVTTILPDELFYEVTHDAKADNTTIGVYSKLQVFGVDLESEDHEQLSLLIDDAVNNA
jgi:hypothetical protein